MTRILITGGRHYNDWQRFNALLDGIHRQQGITLIIQGGASGADALARAWGINNGVEVANFPADWKDVSRSDAVVRFNDRGEAYDAMAGFRRNQEMIDFGEPDLVICWPGGNGTKDMTDRALKAGIPTLRINAPPEYSDLVIFTDDELEPLIPEPPPAPIEWLLRPDPNKPRKPRRHAATPEDRYVAEY